MSLCRQHDALGSRESIPDESLIAEGWIVAGTIMSNRDYRSGGQQTDTCISVIQLQDTAVDANTVLARNHPAP